MTNEFLAKSLFDLYELTLFHLVVKCRSFTKAARAAGITQSAISRQILGMENALGLPLLERTTRTVRPTEAGKFLDEEAARLLGDVDRSLRTLTERFSNAPKQVRLAVSRSIGLAYLPGFLHANLRRLPQVTCKVNHLPATEIMTAVESDQQDFGILCPPRKIPRTLKVVHRFQDALTIIAPIEKTMDVRLAKEKERIAWLQGQNWLLLHEQSQTGKLIRSWLKRLGWRIEPTMELDNFDLIISLVSLGLGVSVVPTRALALYQQRRKIVLIPTRQRLTREIVVIVRKNRSMPDHITKFVENILF